MQKSVVLLVLGFGFYLLRYCAVDASVPVYDAHRKTLCERSSSESSGNMSVGYTSY